MSPNTNTTNRKDLRDNNNNNNNVYFNTIIRANRGWQFLLWSWYTIFLNLLHHPASIQIAPNWFSHILFRILLNNNFSSSHQSPVPWLYVFGNNCLDVYSHKRLYTTISSILTITPTLYLRTSLETLSANLTPHIVLTICHSNPNNLNSSGIVSFQVSLQYKRTSLLVHFIMLLQREIVLANQTPPKSRPHLS